MSTKKGFSIVYLLVGLLLFVLLFSYLYTKQERFVSIFRKRLEGVFSKALGADIRIGDIGGNIFKNVALRNLSCRANDFTISFQKARLDYSLWDIISKRKFVGEENVYTVIELEGGLLRTKDNRLICKNINSRAWFGPKKIIIERLNFNTFSFLENQIRGEILKRKNNTRLKLSVTGRRFFDKEDLFNAKLDINIRYPQRKIHFDLNIKPKGYADVLIKGSFDSRNGILGIGSKIEPKNSAVSAWDKVSVGAEFDTKRRIFRAALNPLGGRIMVNGDYSKWPLLTADITNDHIKIHDMDFSNIVHLSSRFIFKDGDFSSVLLDGYTEATIINYYPFDESEISCLIDRDVLRLMYIKIGDSILLKGVLTLKDKPHKIFLKTTISNFDISRLSYISKETKPVASGTLSGEVSMEGALHTLDTKAALLASDGYLGTVDYKNMILNIKGTGPMLTVYDSRLIRDDSYLTLDGTLDLRKLGSERFMENLTISTDNKTIIWEGWDISKTQDAGELNLKKGLNGGVKVGFKKYMTDETIYQSAKPQDEIELEYEMLDKNSSLQFKTKENEEFLGVMKKYKF